MPSHLRAGDLTDETLKKLQDAHVDITSARVVELQTSYTGRVLWVNVNGVCVLRICRIELLKFSPGMEEKNG